MRYIIISTLLFTVLASPIDKELRNSGELTHPEENEELEDTEEVTSDEDKSKSLHIYTEEVPKIEYFANKYYITMPNSKKQQPKRDKEKERRPYNQVNVYVYFDNSTMMNDKLMVMTDSDMHGGSTTIEEEPEERKPTLPKCATGQAIINGLCVGFAK